MPHPDRPLRRAALASLLALAVAACDRQAPAEPAPSAATAESAADAPTESAAGLARLNAYIAVHNVLVNGGGPEGVRERYERAVLDTRRKTNPGFAATWLPRAIDELREARALPSGGAPALESAADAMQAALEAMHRNVERLPAYFESRAWADDGGAALQAGHAQTLASIDAAGPAVAAFDAALAEAASAQEARHLAVLQDSGDALVYNAALAMQRGKALVRATQAAVNALPAGQPKAGAKAGAKTAPDWTASDAALAGLEASMAAARAEMTRRRDTGRPGLQNLPYREFEPVVDSLTSLVGAYRSYRAEGGQSAADTMIRSYNNAVGYHGRTPKQTYRRE